MRAVIAWCAPLPGEGQVDRLLRLLTALVVLLFPAACLLVNRSDSLSLLLLGLIGLCVWIRNGFRSGFGRGDWLFVAAFAGFFFVVVLAFGFGHQTDEGFRLLGRYLRLLFVLPALLALRRYRPPAAAVWTGLGLGAMALGLDAVWESLSARGFLRPYGDTNVSILFGDLATLTTFAFAAGYVYIDGRLPRLGPFLVAGCVFLGLLAGFLSGTRGAWVAMPVLLVLFLSCRHLLHPRTVLLSAIAVMAMFTLLVYLPQTHVLQRLKTAVMQIDVYWAINRDADRPNAASQCVDGIDALRTWIEAGSGQYPPGFSIAVMQLHGADAAALTGYGCRQGAVIFMENRDKAPAWVVLPRYERRDQQLAVTHLLVKGTAAAGYAGLQVGQGGFDEEHFTPLAITAPVKYGSGIKVMALPGEAVWFVPMEAYFGEYRYAIQANPIGERLEMWRAALRLFSDTPLFGVGTGAYQTETQELVAAGRASPDIAEFDHPHSEYFDALANRGVLGLLALFSLLGVPAWLYARRLESRDPHQMGAALGGLLVTVGFAIFGLTETMFIHSVTIGWYVIMTAIFLVSTDAPLGQDTGTR
ncbi:MAG TPA: O-antigen ligase family protein [Gammaproteobacteria bacterium]|nr:O-antigen ligase family protein [Gammaproteobacteria bacterium]